MKEQVAGGIPEAAGLLTCRRPPLRLGLVTQRRRWQAARRGLVHARRCAVRIGELHSDQIKTTDVENCRANWLHEGKRNRATTQWQSSDFNLWMWKSLGGGKRLEEAAVIAFRAV